jgi:hypothetical protein
MNQSRGMKVESFLRSMGNDPVWNVTATARKETYEGDKLIISFSGVGPDDVFCGLVIIDDNSMKAQQMTAMNGEITFSPLAAETPMENPWTESIVFIDEESSEVIREYIGAM